jgi:predicted PurR-regulated permease PerM
MNASTERDYLGKALDIAVRLTVIAIVLIAAMRIFSPFMSSVVWGGVIAIAFYPVFTKLRSAIGDRNKLAGVIFTTVCLAAILVPTILLTGSLLDVTVRFVDRAQEGKIEVPPPTEKVKTWPLIGEKTYAFWLAAHKDLEGTAEKLQPQLANLGEKIVSSVAGLGGAVLQSIIALIIAGILMTTSEGSERAGRSIAVRLAGDDGPGMLDLTLNTIRSVVKGVILVAMIQGLLAAIGLAIANVPGVGLWALLVMVVAIIQLPPLLILGPIIPWVWANNDSTAISVFFTIWALVLSGSDGFLKPLFLGRGVKVPMLVILIGAIGGMLRSGVIGLFVGPVVLAIGWMLLMAWVREDDPEAAPGKQAETTS